MEHETEGTKTKPLQKGRCHSCREWMSKAERAADMTLCSSCYTQAHGFPVMCDCELTCFNEGWEEFGEVGPALHRHLHSDYECSFCGEHQHEALFTSPFDNGVHVHICSACIAIATKKLKRRA